MQIVWFGVGLVVYVAVALVDYRLMCQWATVWYAMAVGLLVLVSVARQKVYGARRWLGWGSFGIQPAEIAKLAVMSRYRIICFIAPGTAAAMAHRWVALGLVGCR